jgi:acyl-CoA thioesterase FadM
MTGTLTVRYLRPTPLHQQLIFHAELSRVEGRKIFADARVEAEGRVTAEASGIFISIRPGGMEALMKKRAEWEAQQDGGQDGAQDTGRDGQEPKR